jgi:hypothetical protein
MRIWCIKIDTRNYYTTTAAYLSIENLTLVSETFLIWIHISVHTWIVNIPKLCGSSRTGSPAASTIPPRIQTKLQDYKNNSLKSKLEQERSKSYDKTLMRSIVGKCLPSRLLDNLLKHL